MTIVKDEVSGRYRDNATGQYYDQVPVGGSGGGVTSFKFVPVNSANHDIAQSAADAAMEDAKKAIAKADILNKEARELRRIEDARVAALPKVGTPAEVGLVDPVRQAAVNADAVAVEAARRSAGAGATGATGGFVGQGMTGATGADAFATAEAERKRHVEQEKADAANERRAAAADKAIKAEADRGAQEKAKQPA